ncbi:TPA: CO dehydrogenase/acetyl-CoA synthase complex subunit epsilon [Candidatus Bathyarchaeota archaeon]|nr:CO dehydrogenase/acetyl-CoA synthase complex subunit epsilon [Candidatus Bathyarchaeota archaeon]
MAKKPLKLRIEELKTSLGEVKGLEISLGKVMEEVWKEPVGPTPFPSIAELRSWDLKLLERYKPFYMPFCDVCCLCTMGKCDLTKDKRGACGLSMPAQQSRIVLLACCIGAATHTAHARHLVEHLIEKYGGRHPIDVGGVNVEVEAPHIRLVCGMKPMVLEDLEEALDYVETELIQLLSATHTGQEGDPIDFESKVFHAGMLDHVAMEVADIAQISAYGFPKADPESPLTDIGFGVVDKSKPVILVIGHNVPSAISIVDYLEESGLMGEVEVCGICCTAHDLSRYNPKAKIVGPISWQLRFIRSGIPDVIVVDEQCIRADSLVEARKMKAPLIATSDKNCLGLPDRTGDESMRIVEDLANGRAPGALILDPDKVGEVAVKTALLISPKRSKFKATPDAQEVVDGARKCRKCYECSRACPNNLPIPEAMEGASKGNLSKLADLMDLCIGCARCEGACPVNLPIHSFMETAAEKKLKEEKFKIRTGRGAIQDIEIRRVGSPIVLGEIPGVVAFVGCANYPKSGREVAEMAEEFAKRRYIVVASGCAAMSMAMYKNGDGKNVYEAYPGAFDAGCVANVGSCVSNAHISGAAIKIASIFARRRLRANYEEIADYILNRVGAVGVAWGAMSQKAASIASGFWRLGIPVMVGPHGIKYRRMLLGRKDREESWYVYDARTGEKVYAGPAPEHLFYSAESKEEALAAIPKLCIRPNDTTKGRMIKLTHYIDLHKRIYGTMPDDLHLFVRTLADIPITFKDEVVKLLKEKGWEERTIPDPTLLPRLIRVRK